MDKKALRKEYIGIRKNIPFEEAQEASERIREKLIDLIAKDKYDGILLYAPLEYEADVFGIFDPDSKHSFYFPKTSGDEMTFYEVKNINELETGNFNVREPVEGLKEIKFGKERKYLAVVPGVAFDESGYRIGYGKGYYDRFFSVHKDACIKKVGVCFKQCYVNDIMHDEFDIPMDEVVVG
ncbi:MAG: 5-formyltetrahydrofolate cyclo-ligase [Lachnospiraceae bacterium]|nr:5-formyltetrahydrofolate cyclo-ligase [Lachnospiraceae bacterium]